MNHQSPMPSVREALQSALPINIESDIVNEIDALQARIVHHQLFGAISSQANLRHYLSHHLWCVWDFMLLGKSVAKGLADPAEYWLPPPSSNAVRLLNEIMFDEEADVLPDGRVASHFEAYLLACVETGVSTRAFDEFQALLRSGTDPKVALGMAGVPAPSKTFVGKTIDLAAGSLATRLGAFCLGREVLVPGMIQRLLECPPMEQSQFPLLRWYIERHIVVDSTKHSQLAIKLILDRVTRETTPDVIRATLESLKAREAMLDGVLRTM